MFAENKLEEKNAENEMMNQHLEQARRSKSFSHTDRLTGIYM